ncbi:type IV secretory system conjugative DNA transfer family protein [Amycolatopsis rhizosphaerae]|uniref:Type IV secretory system conjugative DNA transfer family protein n=1 Tax=Amycolatopsis rhizosphaerae TaxID=2053003 RepID=A0A558DLR3_9PSEU|nr:TraM recognition domain-containing protein [Amycolatopsis rhizosphaerae]TVT61955.1 type IV secretory system conjugative DNA transfer family protein [Amycolatopsis rhizosphaerae]
MRKTISPATDRDFALLSLVVVALLNLAFIAAVLMVGAAATCALLGAGWLLPDPAHWIGGAISVLGHPGQPGVALGPPWATKLAGHTALYWTITTVLGALALVGGSLVEIFLWRRFGPVAAGHATREDIRRELSLAAARTTAEWTRPSLPPAQARRAPLEEVAAPLHLSPQRQPMCTPLENPTGTLAPTQSGKSRKDLVHKAIAAPGALLCSTTKPDLLEFSALLRTMRPQAGPVLVYDATGTVPWPAQLYWSPIDGCQDTDVAYRRAHTMVEAASVGLAHVTGNDKVFRDRAKMVIQAYFLAAAIHDRDVGDLVRWAMSKPADQEPAKLLQQAGYAEHARNLRSEIGMVAETSDAVWMSVRRVLEPLMDQRLRRLCTPRPGEGFDARAFIAQHGSLYIVAGQYQAAQAAPILTALVEHWLSAAQDMAPHTPHRRLDPPATAILDELTNATPVPQIPEIISDSAGRGVLIHWGAQSLAALEDAFTPQRTRQLMDNTTTLSVWGGIKDQRTLEWVSMLTGHHDRRRYQQHTDGLLSAGRTAVGTETVPTYRPGDVRRIRRGRVLVIHRHLDPVLAHTLDVGKRRDWPTIRDHVAKVRAGQVPVDRTGFALTTPAEERS